MEIAEIANASKVIFGMNPMWLSSAILIICYMFIFTDKINRAVISVLGACIMIFAGIMSQKQAIQGIDFNTLTLLVGMMTIVGISSKSGMFEAVAIWSAKKVNANPRLLLIVLALVTALFSAFLDNVTTVILIVPITLKITSQLKINPYPFLLSAMFSSSIGGTATLIGDPPNMLLGTALELSFMDFIKTLTPVVVVSLVFLIIFFDIFWGRHMKATAKDRKAVMKLQPSDYIKSHTLMKKSVSVLVFVIALFIIAEILRLDTGTIAMFGASILLMMYTSGNKQLNRENKVETSLEFVDWTTIFFISGLFAMIYGLELSGVLPIIGEKFVDASDGNIEKASVIMLWFATIASVVVDNVPLVATMIPIVKNMELIMGTREAMMPVWWSLYLGACFGGNGSLVATSGNIIVAGLAARSGISINFFKFLLWALPITIATAAIANVFIYMRFFTHIAMH